MSWHLQWGHDRDLLYGGFREEEERERERENHHFSLTTYLIENPVRTSAVSHELSGETMGVFAVYSIL